MDCKTNHIPLNDHLRSMLRKSGRLKGLPIVEVTGHTEHAMSCGAENSHWKFEDFMAASIGVDTCGKPAIRVKFIHSCTNEIECANNTNTNVFAEMFAYDKSAKTYCMVINKST